MTKKSKTSVPVPEADPIKIGYARVSTSEQDLRMQREALITAGVHPKDIWEEKLSGAGLEKRAMFQGMMKDIQKGDTIYVWKLDRLARHALDLYETVKFIEDKGASLVVLTMPGMDTSTPVGKAMFGMLAVFAEFERAIAYERTMAGLQAARRAGKKGGRTSKLTHEQVLGVGHLPASRAAAQLGMSVPGFKKRLAVAVEAETARRANDADV